MAGCGTPRRALGFWYRLSELVEYRIAAPLCGAIDGILRRKIDDSGRKVDFRPALDQQADRVYPIVCGSEDQRRLAPRAFGCVDIEANHPAYRIPLQRDLSQLQRFPDVEVVLLGSVASNKYVDVLLEVFGERLLFPVEFVGRGDMSRGGLLLRAAEAGQELTYVPVAGAVRRGRRPPKLAPRWWT